MLDYNTVRNWDFGEVLQSRAVRDTLLYACSIGFGADPVHPGELRFAYEESLQTIPTMACVLGSPGFWWQDPRTGVDSLKVVHAAEDVRLFNPLPASGVVRAHNRVLSITDRGPQNGAMAVILRELFEHNSGQRLAEVRTLSCLRGDGGFSLQSGVSDPLPERLPAVPQRAADVEVELQSTAQQALLYRLNGDYNALHADPDVARAAGFPKPILHGLCTFGMAAHAVLKGIVDYDAARIRRVAARFTAPVFPGDRLRFQLWRQPQGVVHLCARVDGRDAVVLDNGVVELS